ncbi:MAG: monovalent cation/H(+) antiporter subunit G [Candidatus Loosdrechtia sp.]|uniref:cation:proton antiporter n=1 Tax=Candidatus Loosdrechtia sp. TaxID=3101272 RepID=UPI003A7047A2|nr:MAG: monovalent cation/H(+) antiporter subunit G [Candidatus Jettenia sp. AMX2]
MVVEIIAGVFLVLGFFFSVIGSIGVLRLPDFYSRIHASGETETLGIFLIFTGLAIYEGLTTTTAKLIFIMFFLIIFNTTGVYVLVRAANRVGLKPWERKKE